MSLIVNGLFISLERPLATRSNRYPFNPEVAMPSVYCFWVKK